MLSVCDVSVDFGAAEVLRGVDLEVKPAELVAILGPSGSGKSTLLRVIAGLVAPTRGYVVINGDDQTGVPVHRRGVGLMFQDGVLFPHLDVAGNVAYGLAMAHVPREEQRQRVGALLDAVGLPAERFAARPIGGLSGGEQQRVALARALAPQPSLLLLDEPFGSLDAVLRGRLADDVRALAHESGTTMITVTHDRAEAFAFADRVAVMDGGRIIQIAPPEELWAAPASELVAQLIGLSVVDAGLIPDGVAGHRSGVIAVRPLGLRLVAPLESQVDALTGRVEARAVAGDAVRITVVLDGRGEPDLRRVSVEVPVASAPTRGEPVHLHVHPDAVSVLPESDG